LKKRIIIPSNLRNIKHVVNTILALVKDMRVEESGIFDIRLSLEEVLINAIKYGNRSDERLSVTIDITLDAKKIIVTVEDKGEGFDYTNMPDPTKEENLLKAGGRGLFLVNHLMDDTEFNKKGNRITMTKYFKKKGLSKAWRGRKNYGDS